MLTVLIKIGNDSSIGCIFNVEVIIMKVPFYQIIGFFTAIIFLSSCAENAVPSDTPGFNDELTGIISNLKGEHNPFPIIESPEYVSSREVINLEDEHLVLLYMADNGELYVYPQPNMLVEVVNDVIDERPVAINFCPLTGTAMAWERLVGMDTVLLRASGYLLWDNLVIEDSLSGSLWSQMQFKGLSGSLIDEQLNTLPLIQCSWKIAKQYFKEMNVFNHACFDLCTPRNEKSGSEGAGTSYNPGDLLYGVLSKHGTSDLFHINDFPSQFQVQYATGTVPVIVIGSSSLGIITCYERKYSFKTIKDRFPIVLEDETGSNWNIFGMAVSGPRKGERLKSVPSFYAYAHAWQDHY